jgi:hypothetical protein
MLHRALALFSIATLALASGCSGDDSDIASSTSGVGGSSTAGTATGTGGAAQSSSGNTGGSGGALSSSSTSSTGTGSNTGTGGSSTGIGGSSSGAGGGSTGTGGGAACVRAAGPVDAPRFVVIGHPFDAQGNDSPDYEVLSLSPAGVLAQTGTHFAMGTAADSEIVFTPDGKLGFAAQDDGSLGAFRMHDDGQVEVITAAFPASFYASRVVMSPEGDHLLVLDENFPVNGGGVYRVDIGCDDTLTDKGRLFESKSAHGLGFLGGSDVILAAREALGAAPVDTALRITLGAAPKLVAAVDAFGHADAIVSTLTLTRDGKFALIGDNSGFASTPNSVAVIGIDPGGISVTQNLPMIEDPYSLQASPFNDAALVVSGFGDAFFVLDYAPAAAAPFSLRGKLPYVGVHPQVPGASVMVKRGALDGRVLVVEVRGVFQVQFAPQGVVTDLGLFDLAGGIEAIASSIGVQP